MQTPPVIFSELNAQVTQDLNRLVTAHIPLSFPACDITVFHQKKRVLQGSWGTCEGIAPGPARLWDIASITKLFTTTGILSLCSQGKLLLDTPVGEWVPEFVSTPLRPLEPGQDPHTLEPVPLRIDTQSGMVDARQITLRQLLTHTSGLHAWRALFLSLGQTPPPPDAARPINPVTRTQEALDWMGRIGFRDRPGRSLAYSDLGFMLLGAIASRCAQKPLNECMDEEIFSPLSLMDTGFNPVFSPSNTMPTELDMRWRGRRAWGEVHDENACAMGGISGHAGLFSTANDVAKLGQAWLEGPDSPLQLSPLLYQQATQVQAEDETQKRGLGFMIKAPQNASCGGFFSAQSFGHTGYTGTSLWIDPQAQLVVSCMSNAVYGGRDMKMQSFRQGLHDLLWQSTAAHN